MKVRRSFSLSAAVFLLALTACKSDNPPLTGPAAQPPPPKERKKLQATANGYTLDIDSRVDILLVIDDSASMRNHQANLSSNIHRFVDELAKVKAIDFHIGYTVVHDSSRYGVVVDRECGGKLNWEDPGTLKALKDSTGQLAKEGRRFVTAKDDFRRILQENLNPGPILKSGEAPKPGTNPTLIQPFVQKSDKNPCASGPEEEELFTPLLGAVDNPIVLNGPNKGFRREGALFVAILLSDAKDQSGLTPEEVFGRLATAVGSERSLKRPRIFTVGFTPGTRFGTSVPSHVSNKCKPDPVWSEGMDGERVVWPSLAQVREDENPLVNLARLSQDRNQNSSQNILSICDENYGQALARFGTQIQKEALKDIRVPLAAFPEISQDQKKRLRVFLGDDVLIQSVPNKEAHWTHDIINDVVIIHAQNIDWNVYKDKKIRIEFTGAAPEETTRPIWQK